MNVEIWSDVVCPWCYIGKRRLERALGSFGAAGDVEVLWRSFQLNPAHPRGVRTDHDQHLAEKLGTTRDEVRQLNERVIALAAAEGLRYDFDRYQVINTFDAHRVAHLGASLGLGDAIEERLMRAQLEEGEVLDDASTLVRLASDVGVPEEQTRAVLETDAYADAVRADIDEAHELGITGVPFFVIDRRFAISGAQPAELFGRALAMAASQESRTA
jgi:predicted DsbA family dithiol-disulfide isomerase